MTQVVKKSLTDYATAAKSLNRVTLFRAFFFKQSLFILDIFSSPWMVSLDLNNQLHLHQYLGITIILCVAKTTLSTC